MAIKSKGLSALALARLSKTVPQTTTALAQAELPQLYTTPVINSSHLPPPIKTYLQKQLSKISRDSGVSTEETIHVPNPFLLQQFPSSLRSAEDDGPLYLQSRTFFTNRRQKLMLEKYQAEVLPPSLLNPQEDPATVIWNEPGVWQGKQIIWSGEWKPQSSQPKGLFSNRRVMFRTHKYERIKQEREDEIEHRVETMAQRVEIWRQVSSRSSSILARAKLVPVGEESIQAGRTAGIALVIHSTNTSLHSQPYTVHVSIHTVASTLQSAISLVHQVIL
jgi:hypothetical protein